MLFNLVNVTARRLFLSAGGHAIQQGLRQFDRPAALILTTLAAINSRIALIAFEKCGYQLCQ
jgi:hypothetical protein